VRVESVLSPSLSPHSPRCQHGQMTLRTRPYSLDAPKKGQRQSEPQPKNSAATLQHENNSEKHAIKTDKITIQGFTSDWGIPQFNDEAEQPLLRNTNSNEKLA
ncbi:hypothetical protein, partial [Sphingobacterium multivorum]